MLKIVSADFVKGATKASQYPGEGLPEFAFFGRSNVGKSSLINMLVNRKTLVKTGSRPGMTRVINFFRINQTFMLADLPGYGYAQRSAKENEDFDRMLAEYASNRSDLRTLFFLMDLRRVPGETEKNTIEYFERLGLEVVIVGTKADKLSNNEIAKSVRAIAAYCNRTPDMVPVSSADKKTGRDVILRMIEDRCRS
ncbi:ribosome biogenesis GTP-binding protein YihA/YsxC [Treponema zuelzerae]|uniref:Probable GTP-binding protein EngB n=1 Tax=Teretinema zuelzerae TaxID=156 RepID=A0AAE3EKW4_9SPIR|nr:ribosome biogenesis GTP-binding protein YihA/YsxC [Teretinema zuelzerae]MCD1655279.1 ribosome biogenesis GTP-binding protein YihA/YsxC [Teretinema zuelzerae]HPO02281.1 ribosome biogenesis GTP-binding protein YihA/YsxC [Treponemataceae bacterium]